MIRRREFITLLGGAAATPSLLWPLATRAQQPAMPVIGLLGSGSPEPFAGRVRMFRQGLSDSGYVEGGNVAIEYRWAEGQYDRLPALAADLVRRRVSVIAVMGTPATLAAKAATATIPIVFYLGADPVEVGVVTSLSRPGGNLTGFTGLSVQLGQKRLQLLHELVSAAGPIGLLVNPRNRALTETLSADVQAAARTLGRQIQVLNASAEQDLDQAFATLARLRASGLVIGIDPFFNSRSRDLAALALRHAMPAIFQYREFAAAGGLISYGPGASFDDPLRPVGVYVARILQGEKAADLPVQQATKVELIINLKTAKALGVEVPATLLARADEVIE